MIIKMRIYRRHDLDLIGLFANKEFDFETEVYKSLKAFVDGKRYIIKFPATDNFSKTVNSKCQVNLFLDDLKDGKMIDFLYTIPAGNRNSFLKSLIRNNLEAPYVSGFVGEIKFAVPKKKQIENINEEK